MTAKVTKELFAEMSEDIEKNPVFYVEHLDAPVGVAVPMLDLLERLWPRPDDPVLRPLMADDVVDLFYRLLTEATSEFDLSDPVAFEDLGRVNKLLKELSEGWKVRRALARAA